MLTQREDFVESEDLRTVRREKVAMEARWRKRREEAVRSKEYAYWRLTTNGQLRDFFFGMP